METTTLTPTRTRFFHPTHRLDGLLALSDAELERTFRLSDSVPTGAAVRVYLESLVAAGLTYLPPCSHTSPDGWCAGHEDATKRPWE